MTRNRSEQQLEDDSTSVAPPQRLRSQTAPQPQPLSGSSRQRVENRTAADDESESIDEDETDEEDENDRRKGDGDSIVDDDSVQGAKKNSRYVFPRFISFSRGFFFFMNDAHSSGEFFSLFQHLPHLSRCFFIFLF